MTNISILGCGNIGKALLAGLLQAGHSPQNIVATARSEESRTRIYRRFGVRVTQDNREAVAQSDVIFVCVKPHYVDDVLQEIGEDLPDDSVVVSMAAGITMKSMEETLPAGTAVIRVMPNTPMLVGKGMSPMAPGRHVGENAMGVVEKLLQSVGQVIRVTEAQMDAVSAISGAGPAYYYLFTEALIDASVSLGLPRDVATQLATVTAAGAGAMLEADPDPVTLRANVSSPGGVTVAGLRELEESGIRGAMFRAVDKASRRSAELK